MAERRISTPLVLAAASAMIAIASVVALSLIREQPDAPEGEGGGAQDQTPERAATSFYDAWRRRRWPLALSLSVGDAHAEVLNKQARDEALPQEERVIAERMWDALSRAPLELALDEAEMPEDGTTILHGTAEYLFVNRPYRRRVSFVVVRRGEEYRVSEMHLGEVLTPLPDIFAGADEGEPP